MVRKSMSSSRSMRRVYIYTVLALMIGILMSLKQQIRQLFGEDLSSPNALDIEWKSPPKKEYTAKVLLPLHYYNPRQADDFLAPKLAELKQKNYGIHTLLLSGSPKVPTNAYIRNLSQENWGIEEIRLHGTTGVNFFALLNLLKANPSLKRVLIWENKWEKLDLKKIQQLLPAQNSLILK